MPPLTSADRMTDEDLQTPLAVLRRVFGYPSFRGQQQEIVEHVVAGGDAIVLMPTGGGKSLCYQLPGLAAPGNGRRGVAADRADEGPGRRAAPGRGARRRAQLRAAAGRGGRGRARRPRGRARSPLRLARAADDAALPRVAAALPGRAVRDRRGALHLAMGPRFPPRLPGARHPQGELPRHAADGPDRDRGRADPARHRRAAASRRRRGCSPPATTGRTCSTGSWRSTRRATTCCAFSTTSIRAMPASSIA